MPAEFSSLLLRAADSGLILLLFVLRFTGYMYAKYFLVACSLKSPRLKHSLPRHWEQFL